MRFSQWVKTPVALKDGFEEYCRFKELESEDAVEFLLEMAAKPFKGRPEQRKAPYHLDSITLFLLAQVPQTLWSKLYAYLLDEGIYKIGQEMKNSGLIAPLRNTESGEEYLGVTDGLEPATPDEKKNYNDILNYLKKKPPYEFVDLGGSTFLIVNHPSVQVSPSAYMYMKINNSPNNEWLREKPERTREERAAYMRAALLKGHGIHGEYLNTFDPHVFKGKKDEHYPYHVWMGYEGINQKEASKVIKDYFDNIHWWHMSSNNPHLDKPQDVATRVSNFTQAAQNPNLMHYRTKTGGAESRREQPIPILSGGVLQNTLGAINGRRNDTVKMMSKDVMDKWHIVLNPDGTSNIQIGRKQNHRNAYQTFDIDDNTASQIMALSDNPDTAAQAAQANLSKAAYIAQQVGMNKKKQGRTPDQIVQLIIEDKSYDACIYPFWDAERNLHSSTLQAMPMFAPQRMIPSNAYLEHRWHRQLCAWLVKDLKSNPEDMQKFRTLYINLPPITDIAQVRRYAGVLKSVEAESTEIPEEELQRELISAGFNIEILKKPKRESNRKSKSRKPGKRIREQAEPQPQQEPQQEEVKKRKNKSRKELIKGMEIALFARAFQFWLHFERKPPLDIPHNHLPANVDLLLDEFERDSKSKAEQIVSSTRLGDVFDHQLEKVHATENKTWATSHKGGRIGSSTSPWHHFGTTEEFVAMKKYVEEEEREAIRATVLKGIQKFVNSEQSQSREDPRQFLIQNAADIATAALSEYLHAKGGNKAIWEFIQKRAKVKQSGGDFDKKGRIINLDDPVLENDYNRTKETLTKDLKQKGLEFANRIWQLDLGWGSRRKPRAGATTGTDVDAGNKFDDDIASAFIMTPQELEVMSKKFGVESFTERKPEKEGMIFGSGIRRRYQVAQKLKEMRDQEALDFQNKFGVNWGKMDDEQKKDFMQLMLRLRTRKFTAETKGLVHIAETARRAKYNELDETGALQTMNQDSIEKELDEAARIAALEYRQNQEKVFVGQIVDIKEINMHLGELWGTLKEKYKNNILEIWNRIQQDYRDEEGHLMMDKIPDLKLYLEKIEAITQHLYRGEKPDVRDSEELVDSLELVEDEENEAKKYRETPGPFKQALLKTMMFFASDVKKHLTIIADEKKKYLISDLRHLSNPRILRVPEWRTQAESILKTQKHHGRSIPADIYEEFAPKIKEALRTAA